MAILDLKPHIGLPPVWDNNPFAIPPPVGAWIFNEGSGDTAFDLSGNGNDITWGGAGDHWSGGNAIFNGVDDRIDRDKQLFSGYPFTLTAEIRTTGSGNYAVVTLADSSVIDVVYGMDINNGDTRIAARNTGFNAFTDTTIKVNDGKRHTITGVFESDTKKHLYIDGIFKGTLTVSVTYNTLVDRLSVGVFGDDSPNEWFLGGIANVHAYNVALSPAQIAFISANPYYAWDYLLDITAILAAQEVAAVGIGNPLINSGLVNRGLINAGLVN